MSGAVTVHGWAIEIGRGKHRRLRFRASPHHSSRPRGTIGEAWHFWLLGIWPTRADARYALASDRREWSDAVRFARVVKISVSAKIVGRQ